MSGKLKLRCLVWPDKVPDEHTFQVELDVDETLETLKDCIKDKRAHHLADIDAVNLTLWGCSIPIDDNLKENLGKIRFDGADPSVQRLRPAVSEISEHFGTTLPRKTIHVLVELPAPENDAPPAPLPASLNLLQQRQQYDNDVASTAPSTAAQPANFSKMQEDPKRRIIWRRPPSADGTIPVVLYHRIMREFIDDCANHQPIDQDNTLVLKLMDSMPLFLPGEEARTQDLLDILNEHGISTSTPSVYINPRQKFDPDGAIESSARHFMSIFELKGDIGSKGAEPYAQAILYYLHSNSKKTVTFPTFNFPCLIVTVFGPQISFSGAVWTGRPHFQVLTPTIPMFFHQSDTNMRESLARHFGAFKKAIQSLEQCYEELRNPALLEDLNPEFPDPRTYRCLEKGSEVKFKYLCQMDAKKLLFRGKTSAEVICIKFVRRYSRPAHEKCASMRIAPKLRGFEDIGAGWTMVIMDDLGEEYKTLDKNAVPAGTWEDISAKLSELHQAHFVHGDVRNVNTMVRKDGKPGFMLVDFDWAGIIGEVRYPANVNKVDLWRPDDVSDGTLIKSEHDIAMLERMFR